MNIQLKVYTQGVPNVTSVPSVLGVTSVCSVPCVPCVASVPCVTTVPCATCSWRHESFWEDAIRHPPKVVLVENGF